MRHASFSLLHSNFVKQCKLKICLPIIANGVHKSYVENAYQPVVSKLT